MLYHLILQITNVIPVKDIPYLTIQSDTGTGAIIKPQIAPRPEYQGEIKQVIDCITPRDGIVGFINGEPYYGSFHIHPQMVLKMTGAKHLVHAIIYDTPAESRTSVVWQSTTPDHNKNCGTNKCFQHHYIKSNYNKFYQLEQLIHQVNQDWTF